MQRSRRVLRIGPALCAGALVGSLFAASVWAAAPAARRVYGLVFTAPVVELGPCLLSALQMQTPAERCIPWTRREASGVTYHDPSDLLLTGGSDAFLRALEGKSGRTVYRSKLPGALISKPSVHGMNVYFGTENGHVIAMDAPTGKTLWDVLVDAEVEEPVVIDNGRVLVVTGLDSVYALNQESGEPEWVHKRPLPGGITLRGQARPLVASIKTKEGYKRRVYVGHATGELMVLDAESGQRVDVVDLARGEAFNDIDADPVLAAGHLIAASHASGLFALHPEQLTEQWRLDTKGIVRLANAGPRLVVAAGAGFVMGVDATSGIVRWRFKYEKGAPTRLAVQGGRVHVASDRGSLYVLDAFSGEPLQYYGTGLGIAADLELHRDALFLVSTGGHLHALSNAFAGPLQRKGARR